MQYENERKFLIPTYLRQQWDNGPWTVGAEAGSDPPRRGRPRVKTELLLDQAAESLDGEKPLRIRGVVPLFATAAMAFGAIAVGAEDERPFLKGLVAQAARRPLSVLFTNKTDVPDSRDGVTRQERQWRASGIVLTPEAAKVRAYVPCPLEGDWEALGLKEVVIDHYIYPEVPYDVLEVEGDRDAVDSFDASDWSAFGFGRVSVQEVTGSKEWSNWAMIELAREQRIQETL